MERSLSALLPLYNAQSTIAATVHHYLEILPELTGSFEVVVADDGSTDATIEVADELAVCYPQVRVARHAVRRGRVAAIRTAVARSTGDVLLVRDEGCDLPLDDLGRLWRAIERYDIVLGRVSAPWDTRQPARAPTGRGGLQMFSRGVIPSIVEALVDQDTLLEALAEGGYRWREVEMAAGAKGRAARTESASRRGVPPERASELGHAARTDPGSDPLSGPKSRNYLARLRDFALGE